MVVQGVKDRSRIWEDKVTRKQGCGDEGETREAREGKQGKTRRWVSMGVEGRSREDPGEIHRSVGVWCSGVSEEKERRSGLEGRE